MSVLDICCAGAKASDLRSPGGTGDYRLIFMYGHENCDYAGMGHYIQCGKGTHGGLGMQVDECEMYYVSVSSAETD